MIGGAAVTGRCLCGVAGARSYREHTMKMKLHEVNSRQPGNAGRLSDVATLRARARQDVVCGALTRSYGADRDTVLRLLNEALATELVCALRYRRHYFVASGLAADSVRQQFLEHAQQELEHADRIAARIVQLNGEPDFNPRGLTERSHAEYIAGDSLESMIREDLVAERIAIDSYRQIIAYLASRDPTTRRLVEEILTREEEHAEDLARLLQAVSSAARGARL
jgi:bacterioferritin